MRPAAAALPIVCWLSWLPAAGAQQPDVQSRVKTIVELGCSGAGAAKSVAALRSLLDEQIAFAPLDRREAFSEPAGWLRVCRLAATRKAADEPAVLSGFHDHPEFALRLAFLWRAEAEKPGPIVDLAERLLRERAGEVDRFPSLAAAVCVVFDRERTWEFGKSPDAIEIFDYFTSNDSRLLLSTRETPPELLVHVVDSLVGADQLAWALDRYAGDRQIGKRYAQVTYDRAHFPGGAPLKLASSRATLADMLKLGGVCRHQTHYAMHTAKAQGIPSAYVRATGSDVSHAWLGFLEVSGESARWNCDTGRFGEYSQMTGRIADPQTGRSVGDGRLALAAVAASEPPDVRWYATALVDAAARLADSKSPYPPEPPEGVTSAARENSPALRLSLLEAAVNASPAHAPAWDATAAMAAEGLLSPDDALRWARAAVDLCGADFPDFAFEALGPLINSVKDPAREDEMWEWVYARFSGGSGERGPSARKPAPRQPPRRADLAARARFAQGEVWEKAGDPARAWDRYSDVIDRFANNGPFIVDAASRCEALLVREGKPEADAIALYARAFAKVSRPSPSTSPEFLVASNYARIGGRYAALLDTAGRDAEAAKVRATLPVAPKKPRP
ncbi:MAG: hypothetical protein DYG92_03560 [Leptolyngbya sp. PLA1]|nr:hypothetical protein [Leptolyngbya sp. PLA1]